MFGVIFYGRLRIYAAINGLSLPKSRPFLQFLAFATSSSVTSANNELQKAKSFTVSYLVNSCGLSPEAAIVASKKVRLRNPETPDSVLVFLRDQGFSNTQISRVVRRFPRYLLSDPTKNFLPKLEFFYSKGISKETMAEVLSKDATILERSLTNYIVPTFDLLKTVCASDEQAVSALKHQWVSYGKHWENVLPNIRLLKSFGLSDLKIGSALIIFSGVMIAKPEKFIDLVGKVRNMGFDPRRNAFMYAVRTFAMPCYEKRWRENFKVYKKWGWSESDILCAFKYHPNCMLCSEKKIDQVMDYLVNVMGYPTKEIVRVPVVLCYSLEKRIRPRCSVVRVLSSKSLAEQDDFKLSSLILYTDKIFLAKYVTMYEKQVPLLMSVYQGKVGIDEA